MTSYRRAVTMATYRWTGLPLLLLMLLTSTGVHVGGRSTDEDDNQSEDASNPNNMSDEKRLIKKLLGDYEKVGLVGRPVFNQSETIKVKYGLSLIQILDLDEKNQVLTTNCWSRYQWVDVLLKWDPSNFGGVAEVRVPTNKIWTPDIVLYNYADTRQKEQRDAMAVVTNDGTVLWIPPAIFKSTCQIDITNFPYDIQKCKMKFGSWTYDGYKLDIVFYENETIEIGDYIVSNEWKLVGWPATRNVVYYTGLENVPYPDLTFTVMVQRVAIFHKYILVLPCVLLSFLTLVIFWLPPESPAKVMLGMSVFVAFFVLLLLLADSTPPAAKAIPLIGAYFCMNMILITLSTFLAVVIIQTHIRGDRKNKVPPWLKRIAIDGMARVLCMSEFIDKEPPPAKGPPPPNSSTATTRPSAAPTSTIMGGIGVGGVGVGSGMMHHQYASSVDPQSASLLKSQLHYGTTTRDAVGIFNQHHHQHQPPYQHMQQPQQQQRRVMGIGNSALSSSNVELSYGTGGRGGNFQPPPSAAGRVYEPVGPVASMPVVGSAGSGPGDRSPVLCSGPSFSGVAAAPVGNPSVENDVREIRRMLKSYIGRLENKDAAAKTTKEWRIVARVLDRLFFFCYIGTIVVSLFTVFPRENDDFDPTLDDHSATVVANEPFTTALPDYYSGSV